MAGTKRLCDTTFKWPVPFRLQANETPLTQSNPYTPAPFTGLALGSKSPAGLGVLEIFGTLH